MQLSSYLTGILINKGFRLNEYILVRGKESLYVSSLGDFIYRNERDREMLIHIPQVSELIDEVRSTTDFISIDYVAYLVNGEFSLENALEPTREMNNFDLGIRDDVYYSVYYNVMEDLYDVYSQSVIIQSIDGYKNFKKFIWNLLSNG